MSRSVLVLHSDPNLHGTGRLGAAIARSGLDAHEVCAWEADVAALRPSDHAAIAVMGGEMNALDDARFPYLADEAGFLRRALADDVPVLGICLGGQLLARALGAEVTVADELEGGWLPIEPVGAAHVGDPVLGHLDGPTGVFVWHHDVFALPEGATLLARSEVTANQAFRHGRAWGLQFHPEVDGDLFESWLAAHPALQMDEDASERLRGEVRLGASQSLPFLERLFDGFLAQAG
jgi:GMP synthase-like glutamine amidotransferase